MDGLDLSLLKLVADIIAKPLTHIFNLSLEQNIIPESWKIANVDENLSFNHHVTHLVKKLGVKLGFYFRNKAFFI